MISKKANEIEIRECVERIRILAEAHSELEKHISAGVEIPAYQEYKVLKHNLRNLIDAEGARFKELIKKGE